MKPSSPSSCNIVQETLSPSSNGTTAAGCISKILRRILCFSSLSYSCPFDHHMKEEQRESSAIGGAVPGIVARLMGLSSLPRIEPIEGSPTISSCPDSFKKSRSPQVVMRRKIRVPAYQELEDDKFFILSFERRGDRHGPHVERWRLSKNSDRTEQSKCKKKSMRRTRENLQGKNKESRGLLMVSKGTMDRDYQVDQNPSNVLLDSCRKPEKRRKKKGNGDRFAAFNVEREGDSENSSPNSVLEFVEFPTDQESSCTGDISRLANSKMRRTLSEELENCGNKSEEKKLINSGFEKLRKIDQNCAEKWEEICKLAGVELIKSKWLDDKVSKDEHNVKEIGRDIASCILDQLLDELMMV